MDSCSYREVEGQVGHWWSVDPITHSWESSYASFHNNPVFFTDPFGSNPKGDDPPKGDPPWLPDPGDYDIGETWTDERTGHKYTKEEDGEWWGEGGTTATVDFAKQRSEGQWHKLRLNPQQYAAENRQPLYSSGLVPDPGNPAAYPSTWASADIDPFRPVPDYSSNVFTTILQVAPFTSDVIDIVNTVKAIGEGKWGDAVWSGIFLLPYSDAAKLPKLVSRKAAVGVGAIRGAVRYGPMNPGPLADDIANTFRSGSYTARTLDEPTTLYRVIGDNGNPTGSYWTSTKPKGPLQSVIDLALDQNWGNTATTLIRAQVPAGTRIYEGAAAAQRGLVGGGNQIYIPQVNSKWIQP